MVTQQYICDGCGAVKGVANHWYTLAVARDLMQIRTWRTGVVELGVLHLCGEGCLQRAISVRLGREGFVADTIIPDSDRDIDEEPVVSLRERLDELDSRDIDWEVGAR